MPSDNKITVNSDRTAALFLEQAARINREGKYVEWTYRIGPDEPGLSQLALFHIWLKKWAAHALKKPERDVTKEELNGMKRAVKVHFYNDTHESFMIETIMDPFHPGHAREEVTSAGDWKPGEIYMVMNWMQDKAAQQGLILKSEGKHKKLKQKENR